MAYWLGFQAFTATAWVQSLAREQRSHKPCGAAKKPQKTILHWKIKKKKRLSFLPERLRTRPWTHGWIQTLVITWPVSPGDTTLSLSCPFYQCHVTLWTPIETEKNLHGSRTESGQIHIFLLRSCACPMTHSRCGGQAVHSVTHPWTTSHHLVHFLLTN